MHKMPKHHAQNIDVMLKHHSKYRMLKIQKCSHIICSKAEIFIHVAIYNSELRSVVIVHKAQDNSWTTGNFNQLCCVSDHFIKISSQI